MRMMRRIAIPLIGANLAAGAILGFAFSMLEVSDSLILAQQAQHYPITGFVKSASLEMERNSLQCSEFGQWCFSPSQPWAQLP